METHHRRAAARQLAIVLQEDDAHMRYSVRASTDCRLNSNENRDGRTSAVRWGITLK